MVNGGGRSFVVVTTMYPFRESTITTFCSLLWRGLTLETSAQNLFTEANLHASINSVDKNQIKFSYFLIDAAPQFLQKLTPFILYHIDKSYLTGYAVENHVRAKTC